jgi:hypothetical protein
MRLTPTFLLSGIARLAAPRYRNNSTDIGENRQKQGDRPNRKPHRGLKPTKGTETDLRQKLSKVVRELAV